VALFSVAAVVPFALVAWLTARRDAAAWLLLLAFAVVAYVETKHAWGGNQLEDATSSLLFLTVVYAAALPFNVLPRWRAAWALAALVIGAAAGATVMERHDPWAQTLVERPWDAFVYLGSKDASAARLVASEGKKNRDGLERMHERIRELARLPPLSGTVDAFPDYSAVVVSLPHVVYTPRPMFLSINAQTHSVLQANARFYRGPRAPRTVLFEVFVYPALPHDRYPTTADGPSWLALLSHYEVTGTTRDFVVLGRARTVPYTLEPLGARDIHFGDAVALPGARGGMLWARIEVARSALGTLLDAVYKVPPISIVVDPKRGPKQSFRLVPEMAREGFLLSPLITSNADYILLSQARHGHDLSREIGPLSSLTLRTSEPASVYKKTIRLRLYRLRLAAPVAGLGPEIRRLLSLKHLLSGPKRSIFPVQLAATGVRGRTVLFAHAPSRIEVAVPRGSRSVALRYGFESSSWNALSGHTDGAEFRLLAASADRTRPIWHRFVNPVAHPRERAELTASAEIPIGTRLLFLETLPGPRGDVAYDHTYWAGLAFRPRGNSEPRAATSKGRSRGPKRACCT
jgi:hypothetical protein